MLLHDPGAQLPPGRAGSSARGARYLYCPYAQNPRGLETESGVLRASDRFFAALNCEANFLRSRHVVGSSPQSRPAGSRAS